MTIAFLSSVLPALLLPFVNVLPYLQRFTLSERLPFFAVLFFAAIAATKAAAPERWQSWANAGKKNILALLASIVGAAFAAAMLAANSLGSLAWLAPGEPYAQSFTISSLGYGGSKYRSVELQLRSSIGERSLVLSKRMFHYPQFIVGQSIVLHGRSSVFGVYVERFELP